MNYIKIDKCSIADGPGARVVLWVSGCSLHCKNCHNPEAQSREAGKLFDEAAKQELFKALAQPYIRGITLSGGHPLEDYNIMDVYDLLQEVYSKFPDKDIWLYTGYLYEDIPWEILTLIDVIVDGPYIDELRDITLPFRGSSNQRLIDVKESLHRDETILYQLTF